MPIKKGDFIKLEYTGKLKESAKVFDTTSENIAKAAGIFNPRSNYKPIVICVGEHHILPGIDEFVEGKEVGEHSFDLVAQKAFGKKNPKLLQMIPMSIFTKQKIKPVPGLQLNIDNSMGIVKTVSGGRIVVDFNHPLSGKDVSYELKIESIITDKKEQVKAITHVLLGLKEPVVTVEGKKAVIKMPAALPVQILDQLKKKIESLVSDIEVGFDSPKEAPAQTAEEHAKTCDDPAHKH